MGACVSSVEVESEEYINTGGLNSLPMGYDSLRTSIHCSGLEKGTRLSTGSTNEPVTLKGATTKRISSESLLKKKSKQHVLLLGTSGSGKTTLMKHLRVMYNKGHFHEEKVMYKKTILNILVSSVRQLIEYVGEKNKQERTQVSEYLKIRMNRVKQIQQVEEMTADEREALNTLCSNRTFCDVLEEKARKFSATAQYFINSVGRITKQDWIPEEQDILMVGQTTHGACVMDLKIQRKHRLRVVDVGGLRKERRKWPHFFDGVTAVVFCVSLSDYDECLDEDPTVNKMQESLQLFAEMLKNEALKDATILLFFNKKDLFREKIKKTNITTAFPDYTGAQDYDDALDFIHQQFLRLSKHSCLNISMESEDDFVDFVPQPSRPIFCHTTCAVSFVDMQQEWGMALRSILARPRLRAESY